MFPELTHFGRVFKANGYTLSNLKQVRDVGPKKEELLELSQFPPLSIMAQISYTRMKTGVPDLASAGAPGVAQNGKPAGLIKRAPRMRRPVRYAVFKRPAVPY